MNAHPAITASDVARAASLARRAHDGQADKVGDPYIEHPAEVADRVSDQAPIVQVVAWLHDVVEDTDVTLGDIDEQFGPDVAAAVDAISHRPHEPRTEYYARVKANPTALRVKEADLATNTDPWRTRRLDIPTRERLATKYAKAYDALGLARSAPLLPDGRIPVNVGDFATRGGWETVLIAWVGDGPHDVVAVFTVPQRGYGVERGTAALPTLLNYHGVDPDRGHFFSLPGEWVVTDALHD